MWVLTRTTVKITQNIWWNCGQTPSATVKPAFVMHNFEQISSKIITWRIKTHITILDEAIYPCYIFLQHTHTHTHSKQTRAHTHTQSKQTRAHTHTHGEHIHTHTHTHAHTHFKFQYLFCNFLLKCLLTPVLHPYVCTGPWLDCVCVLCVCVCRNSLRWGHWGLAQHSPGGVTMWQSAGRLT